MKVILLQDLTKLGKRGEVKEVADGYAINVLIAQKKALQATPAELAKWKQADEKKKKEKDSAEKSFFDLIDAVKKSVPTINVKKHDNGHLFAAISAEQVTEALFTATHISVNPSQLEIKSAIKALGNHVVTIKQGDKKADFSICVISEK